MFDKQKIHTLASLPDDELKKALTEAAKAAGADERFTHAMLADTGKVRRMLGTLSEEQISRILAGVDPAKADALRRSLGL